MCTGSINRRAELGRATVGHVRWRWFGLLLIPLPIFLLLQLGQLCIDVHPVSHNMCTTIAIIERVQRLTARAQYNDYVLVPLSVVTRLHRSGLGSSWAVACWLNYGWHLTCTFLQQHILAYTTTREPQQYNSMHETYRLMISTVSSKRITHINY